MKMIVRAAASLAPLMFAGLAQATNGYLTDALGIKNEGLAGAGSADPEEAMIMATNPAGLAYVGGRTEAGLNLFSPIRTYSTSASLANGNGGAFTIGPNAISSGNKIFPLPYLASEWTLDPQNTIGAALYARGGMDTTWKGGSATFAPGPGAPVTTFPGTYGDGTAGVDLMQAFFNFSLAHANIDHTFSVGASAVLAAQRFSARGLANFAPYTETFAASGGTQMPTSLSNNGSATAFGGGAALGVEWHPDPHFSAALAYTSRIYMSKLTKYADLFAGGGSFDIPANATLGLTFKPVQRVALSLDGQEILYKDVAAVGDPIASLFGCPTVGAGGTNIQNCLGGNHGAGFGWRDMTIYKLGMRWQATDDWTGRIGVSHGTQPIPGSEMTFNILAPGVVENHVALGLTRRHGENGEFNLSLTYAANKTISGPNTFDPTQTIRLGMHQLDLGFGYAWLR